MRKDFGDHVNSSSVWEDMRTIAPIIIGVFVVLAVIIGGIWWIGETFFEKQETRDARYDLRKTEENKIKTVIADDKLTCEYIGDLRMEYAGVSGFTPIDNNFIQKKLMTYWNVNSCGVEWNWYND